jgi:two-component system sensor histidine kinase BaeS
MYVYQEAYGCTRLRLLVDVFESWLGLLVLCGARQREAGQPRPDAWIAERNLGRARAAEAFAGARVGSQEFASRCPESS